MIQKYFFKLINFNLLTLSIPFKLNHISVDITTSITGRYLIRDNELLTRALPSSSISVKGGNFCFLEDLPQRLKDKLYRTLNSSSKLNAEEASLLSPTTCSTFGHVVTVLYFCLSELGSKMAGRFSSAEFFIHACTVVIIIIVCKTNICHKFVGKTKIYKYLS